MRTLRSAALPLCLLIAPALFAQRNTNVLYQGERIYAIVPMVGDGKSEPRRPMFSPLPPVLQRGETAPAIDEAGISGFSYILSDDGNYALVEFVARHPKAFDAIKKANLPDVKVFARNQTTLTQLEQEFRPYKPGFTFGAFPGFGGGVR